MPRDPLSFHSDDPPPVFTEDSMKLHWQILAAMILGIGFALAFGDVAIVDRMADLFMRLLRMVILPLVFTSIVNGVAGIGDTRSLGRLGLKTFLYYIGSSLLAILIGLALTLLVRPGVGLELSPQDPSTSPRLETPDSLAQILVETVPDNVVRAAADFDVLGIIFFSILLGATLGVMKGESGERMRQFFTDAFEVTMKLTDIVMKLLPVGVFALMARAIATTGFGMFDQVGRYVATLLLGLTLHLFVALPLVFWLTTKKSPLLHYRAMREAMATAFSTSSSSVTLPVTMKDLRENAGVSDKVTSFVVPMGATVNMDGTALYECAGALFIAQAIGVELTSGQLLIVVVTALLASIGAATVPSAGLVMIFIVLEAVGIATPEAYALVGVMLAVDRPLDMYRTVVNVTSDSVGAAVIAHSEGETLDYSEG